MRFSVLAKVSDDLLEEDVIAAFEKALESVELNGETLEFESLSVKRRKEIDRKDLELSFRPGSKAEETYNLIKGMVEDPDNSELLSRAQIATQLEMTPSNVTAVLRKLQLMDEDLYNAYVEQASSIPRTAPKRFVPAEKQLTPRQAYISIKRAIAEGESDFSESDLAAANEYAAFHGFNTLVPVPATTEDEVPKATRRRKMNDEN